MQLGFIGLGTMGASMAANLQKAGHKLVVNDVRKAAAERHLAAGAVWADTPKAVAQAAPVIFTSLPGPPELEAVTLGPDGLLAGMSKGSALFDLTTNSPTLIRRLHGVFAEKGAHILDAPVSGGPRGASTGKLALWIGGEEAVFNQHKALLDAIGDQARYVGPIGAGSVTKLVHNCAGYMIQTALAEVFTMGIKGGVEPLALWEAVRQGALGRRRTLDGLIDQFLPNKYDPPAFALRLAHKDVSLATALGRELGVPMRLANLTLEEMTEAMGRGWSGRDSRSTMLLQVERAGVEVAVGANRLNDALERDPPLSAEPAKPAKPR
ncbi:MAG: NAD(P)-dependent oxidoreductase [Alphaproteobacteria bacterium]|nr:NAD(P)-dependent oxidoreductase [Alphaproteobacteria bacterium]